MNQRANSAPSSPLLVLVLVAVVVVAIIGYLWLNSSIDKARDGKSLDVKDVKESAKEAVFDTKSILIFTVVVLLIIALVGGLVFLFSGRG